jgi:hypothetical protein
VSEFTFYFNLKATSNIVRGEICTDPQGGYPRGGRWIDGGSGLKSVSGSSWMNSELSEYGKDPRCFRLVQASGE